MIFARQEERRTSPNCCYYSSVSLMMMERGSIFISLFPRVALLRRSSVSWPCWSSPRRRYQCGGRETVKSVRAASPSPRSWSPTSSLWSSAHRSAPDLAHSLEVHTALVKLLSRISPTEVVPLIKKENCPLDFMEFFESENFPHFQASLY